VPTLAFLTSMGGSKNILPGSDDRAEQPPFVIPQPGIRRACEFPQVDHPGSRWCTQWKEPLRAKARGATFSGCFRGHSPAQ
jgi:hypothetical protein